MGCGLVVFKCTDDIIATADIRPGFCISPLSVPAFITVSWFLLLWDMALHMTLEEKAMTETNVSWQTHESIDGHPKNAWYGNEWQTEWINLPAIFLYSFTCLTGKNINVIIYIFG